jgi:hypothetical protein
MLELASKILKQVDGFMGLRFAGALRRYDRHLHFVYRINGVCCRKVRRNEARWRRDAIRVLNDDMVEIDNFLFLFAIGVA